MKRRAFNILAGLSVALWLVTVVLWLRSYHHSDFVQLFTSEPKLMPMTTTAQAKAWERLRARTGWDGVYTARYMATAFANGNGYFFRGIQSIIVTDRKDPPPRLMWGAKSDRLLMLDQQYAMFASLATRDIQWAGFSFFDIHTRWQLPLRHSKNWRTSVERQPRCPGVAGPLAGAVFGGRDNRGRQDTARNVATTSVPTPPGQLCPECGTAVPEDLIRKPMA